MADYTGVNSVDNERGVYSSTENRWIPNEEIRNYFAANPNLTADQIVAMGGQLGLSPYAIQAAVWQGQGAQAYGTSTPEQQKLSTAVTNSMNTGSSGWGNIRGGGHTTDSTALAQGSGMHQYSMPDGSLMSVDVQNFRPTQTYAQALAQYRPYTGAGANAIQPSPEAPYTGGQYMNTSGTGTPAWAQRPAAPATPLVAPGQTYGAPAARPNRPTPVPTPEAPPAPQGFQTPMLDALYAAQQRRMLSPAPVFNFQNNAATTPQTGALTQTQGVAAGEPYMNTGSTGAPAWTQGTKAAKGNVQTPYSGPQGALTQAISQ